MALDWLLFRPVRLVIGLAYPAFVAHRAVAANDAELLRRTYHHFIVVSAFFTVEAFLDIFLFWLPLYPLAKLAGVSALVFNNFQLSSYLYAATVKPYLEAHDNRISHALSVAGTTAVQWARTSIHAVVVFATELSRNLPADLQPPPPQQQQTAQVAAAAPTIDVPTTAPPPYVEEVVSPTRARQDAFVEIVHSEGVRQRTTPVSRPASGVQESQISETMVVEAAQRTATPSNAAVAASFGYSAWGLWEWISRPAAPRPAAAPAIRPATTTS